MDSRVTLYGCDPDEAALITELAGRLHIAPTITAAAVSDANADLAAGNRCVSVGHKSPVGAATLDALHRAGVRFISTRSVGCNHLDVEHARRLGIAVSPTAYSPDSVADHTVMMILMALRHVKDVMRRADMHDYRLYPVRGRELRDLTVGVVGAGRIGTAVITRLRGFGCDILVHDRAATAPAGVTLDELLARSDVITLHTPLTTETHHLLDRRRIALLKPGAVIINTGRGPLIDTEALTEALECGRLGGAALDVLEGEEGIFYADWSDRPLRHPTLLRLQRMPNVIITPHTAYATDHALRDVIENSLASCVAFERAAIHAAERRQPESRTA